MTENRMGGVSRGFDRPLRNRLRRALLFARPERRTIGGILGLTLAGAGLNAMEPLLFKYIFDGLAGNRPVDTLVFGIAVLFGLGILRETAAASANWLIWKTRLRIHHALLQATVERLHLLPLSFHRREGVGAIMARLDRSIQGFLGAVGEVAFNILPAVVYLLVSLVIMLRLDWRLAVLVIAFTPFPVLIANYGASHQTGRERVLMERWTRIYSRFNEVLSGIITVRSFAMEDAEKQRFLKDVGEANRVVVRGVGFDAGLGAATNLIVTGARLAALALGGWLVLQGEATIGTLVAFLGYVGGLFGPVQGLSGTYGSLRKASVSLEQIFDLLDQQEFFGDLPEAQEVDNVTGDIAFEDVHFAYEARDRPILDGIDLHIRPGERVAIVGPSGSGKTTLFALLLRFYDPQRGRVLLDGNDLRLLKQRSLRRHLGVVLQDGMLFNDSVRNNIAYSRPLASLSEIVAAAKAANAHEFISRLPDGYETMVGERGSRLSVGERQRIAIARTFIKDPAIVLLDEATSALDAETESLVQESLQALMRGKTAIAIAHRLTTVVEADRILVLRGGRIDESGKHEELMRRNGYYAELVRRQTRGLLRNEGE